VDRLAGAAADALKYPGGFGLPGGFCALWSPKVSPEPKCSPIIDCEALSGASAASYQPAISGSGIIYRPDAVIVSLIGTRKQ